MRYSQRFPHRRIIDLVANQYQVVYTDTIQAHVFDVVQKERKRQDRKWGANRIVPAHVYMTVLTEEVGEVAKEVFGAVNFDGPKNERLDARDRLYTELSEVAAVAVAWMEQIERDRKAEHEASLNSPVVVAPATDGLLAERFESGRVAGSGIGSSGSGVGYATARVL